MSLAARCLSKSLTAFKAWPQAATAARRFVACRLFVHELLRANSLFRAHARHARSDAGLRKCRGRHAWPEGTRTTRRVLKAASLLAYPLTLTKGEVSLTRVRALAFVLSSSNCSQPCASVARLKAVRMPRIPCVPCASNGRC
eukprot:5710830-Pleurochrysis_carterae.AAC.2